MNRDGGDASQASDWFNICNIGALVGTSTISFVGLFIDTSGSMTASTVSASRSKFETDLMNAGLTFAEVLNGRENWITPFTADLSPMVARATTNTTASTTPYDDCENCKAACASYSCDEATECDLACAP